MSASLQSRNVRLVATRHIDQSRSERLIPVARSDRAGGEHFLGFSFEAIRTSSHSAACCRNSAFSCRAMIAGSLM